MVENHFKTFIKIRVRNPEKNLKEIDKNRKYSKFQKMFEIFLSVGNFPKTVVNPSSTIYLDQRTESECHENLQECSPTFLLSDAKRITGFRLTTKSQWRHEVRLRTDFVTVWTAIWVQLRRGFRSIKRTQMWMKICRVIDLVPIFPTRPKSTKSDTGPARSEVVKSGFETEILNTVKQSFLVDSLAIKLK